MTEPYDVAVLGGGASGLAAALAAAGDGARTCIVERDAACGLPILATGNGRCNLSNERLDPRRYRHPDIARKVMGESPEAESARFFDSIGLVTVGVEGRLYPVTKRAESVRDALLSACARAGVAELCGHETVSARRDGGVWSLEAEAPARPVAPEGPGKAELRRARKALAARPRVRAEVRARSVVIACGGTCGDVCALFGLPHVEEEPVLCPIACSGPRGMALGALDGLRVEGVLALKRGGACIAFEEGEVLFRPYGISGIAAFNLSRRIREGDVIELDLFPRLNDAALLGALTRREGAVGPYSADASWYDGVLARPLARAVCALTESAPDPLAAAAGLLHRLPLAVTGTAEPAQAQVRRGGIPWSAVDASTLALAAPGADGVFACGEALDMDADCGGYNLAWAWLSGSCAGRAASALARGL